MQAILEHSNDKGHFVLIFEDEEYEIKYRHKHNAFYSVLFSTEDRLKAIGSFFEAVQSSNSPTFTFTIKNESNNEENRK